MPTLKELDTLKKHINELGDEPHLLAERGESLEDITPPESSIDSDLAQLLVDDNSGGGIDEMEALLGSYADDRDKSGVDEFSIDDLDPLEGLETGDVDEDMSVEDSREEDFSDLDLGDAIEDLSADEAVVDELPPDEPFSEELSETLTDDITEELSDDDIPLDDFTAEEPSIDESPDDTPTDETDEDSFSLDDISFDEDVGSDLPEMPLDEIGDSGGLESLDKLEDLGDLEDLGSEIEESPEDIPDVESAVEGLGDLDAMDAESQGEISLDEDLNFEEELGADVLSDIRDIGDESQQFSMDDFGEQYNFKEGEGAYTDDLGVDLEQLEQSLDEAADDESKSFSIDVEDFTAIRQTLSTLPRNLKIAIEEILADDRRNPEDLKPLIDALITGESPKSLVVRFRVITKRKIELPRSYEKRSGLALEDRRASLVYRLVREGWPVIRVILLVVSIGWLLGAAVFMWAYRPLMAERLYARGLDAIATDDITEAEMYFRDAWYGWPLFYPDEKDADRIIDSPIVVKGWKNTGRWLDYAAALRRRKHWDAAGMFYEGYLRVKPDSKEVRLEYSAFLSGVLGKYEEALELLEEAPHHGRSKWDRDYILAAGDVLLDWAEDDPTKYEEARKRYAKVLEISRNDERAILSMMRYHLRLADDEEIDRLLPIFDSEVPGRSDAPELAAEVFAGLGEYHLARGNADDSRRFINLAMAADPLAPEPQFVDAMFWRLAGEKQREFVAYRRTLVNLDGRESLSRGNLEMRILTLGGMGRIQAANEEYGKATSSYSKALDLFEDARMRNQLGAAPAYGRLYLELGDIMYRGIQIGEDLPLSLALNQESLIEGSDRYSQLLRTEQYYNEAEELFDMGGGGSRLPTDSLYRRAYVRYVMSLDGALLDFHRVARQRPEDYEARIALATLLLGSGDYEASRSQYSRAIELLDDELHRTGGILNPFDRQSHAELLLRYVISWNNLGVGRARSAARGGGEDDYAAALSAFTMASEYLDEVFDDMTYLNSRGAAGMRDIEERRIISESDGRNLLKEKATYPYINRLRLLGLDKAEDGEDLYLMYPDIPSDLLSR